MDLTDEKKTITEENCKIEEKSGKNDIKNQKYLT